MYEVMTKSGSLQPITYPLPWSLDGSYSFLQNHNIYRQFIERDGLQLSHFNDVSETALNSVKNLLRGLQQNKVRKPNLGLLLGNNFPTMMFNLAQALENDSLSVYQIVASKT